ALACGVAALFLLTSRHFWQQPDIPRIALLPAGLLLLIWLQYLLGMLPYAGQALLASGCLLWAALLVVLGRQLREELGLPALAVTLAVFLLAGAEMGAMIGVLQHFGWRTMLDVVILPGPQTGIVYGNLAQSNHYANYTMLGLVSLGLLAAHKRMPVWQTALLAVPLLFAMVLSGSRSAGLYVLCLPFFSWLWQRRDISLRPLFHYSLALLAGFAVMSLLVNLPWLHGASGSMTAVGRLSGAGAESANIRLLIWREAWQIFLQHPLLGAGFGQFAWQHFLLGPTMRSIDLTGLYDNCHNIVLQIAAEMGLAGLLLLIGTLALWLRQLARATPSMYGWWGCALLLTQGIHSMLEYPLWYAYFLGIAALLLGMLDTTAFRLSSGRAGAWAGSWVVAALLLAGAVTLAQAAMAWHKLERAAQILRDTPDVRADLIEAARQPPLKPYADMLIANMQMVADADFASQLALADRVMRFRPLGTVAFRQALLLALLNRPDEARIRMEQAVWSWPDTYPQMQKELEFWAQKDPARCAALLKFALQKYEERQRAAIPAK
ncbi:MAG: Wzy polymerase domain-containing protein, partial [Gallionellaceae bacterium]|nr:Wzy polymerase domain-containing protein [Gallionellaceae bacterium]